MEFIKTFIDFFLHLDVHLARIIADYGVWTYAILFMIVFMETGLVVTPLLPGDSLLFAAGTFAALGQMNIFLLMGILIVAAILGDTVNYWVGHYLGDRAYNIKWIKKEYLDRTHTFFEKHGGKTIFFSAFSTHYSYLCPVCGGHGKDVLSLLLCLQCDRRHYLGDHLLPSRLLLWQHPFCKEAL